MNLTMKHSPYLRTKESALTLMGDMLIAMVPLFVMAAYFYGIRVLYIGAVAVLTCVFADGICVLLSCRKLNLQDFSPVITGLVLALLLPASIPFYVVVSACLFAIVVAKQPFGGTGNNLFNPAGAGFLFAAVCWPNQVFRYPLPLDRLMTSEGEVAVQLVEGSAYTLKLGGVPSIDTLELMLGNYPGPMGATNILVMGTCFLFLVLRKTISWQIPVFYLLAAGGFGYFFPRISADPLYSMLMELFSGSLVYVGIYMMTDPVTSPKTKGGRILYGLLGGIFSMLFRYYGGFEQGAVFALLLMNALSFSLDRAAWKIGRRVRLGLAKIQKN